MKFGRWMSWWGMFISAGRGAKAESWLIAQLARHMSRIVVITIEAQA